MASVLTADEIAEFQGLVEELAMPDTYRIERDTPVDDDEGGYTQVPTTTETGDCRLRAYLYGSEAPVAARLGWTSAAAVDMPASTTLTPADRLFVNGRRFEVGVVSRDGNWMITATVIVQEQGS